MKVLRTTVVGSYPQPDWLIDLPKVGPWILRRRLCKRC
jgi:hypothetical protein